MTNKNNGSAKVDKGSATVDKGSAKVGKGSAKVGNGSAKVDKGSIGKESKDYPLKEFYKKIYGRYDLVNRIFTFGQDRNWRKKAVEECLGNAPQQVLDICTGTGDLVLEMADRVALGKGPAEKNNAGRDSVKEAAAQKDSSIEKESENTFEERILSKKSQGQTYFTGYDFSPEMLEEARKKTADAGQKIEFIEGNVAEMPFADNRFDTAGITFGIRNLIYENSNADLHLAEIHRVLRMNGRLVVLESSRPDSRIWRFFNGIYLQFILPWLGGLISGNLKAYRYLAKSSKNYYSRKEMAGILERAGFRVIRSRPLFLGSVMLLVAEKQEKA